jgi:predicted GNAT superfamily acetyltransferase
MITYRELESTGDLQKVVEMEMIVWDMEPIMAVPHNFLMALIHAGGVVTGAEQDGELVGFGLAFPARLGSEWGLWSHMAGVLPAYQRHGIGAGIKFAQRRWALENGYQTIGWTYDPLQRGNANFNMRLLGAFSRLYHVNFYGEMLDSINAGMPSDRLEITWDLNHPRVIAASSGETLPQIVTEFPPEHFLLYTDENGEPCLGDLGVPLPHFIEIPYALSALKRDNIDTAKRWQLMLRQAMQASLRQSSTVSDFVTTATRGWYVLK